MVKRALIRIQDSTAGNPGPAAVSRTASKESKEKRVLPDRQTKGGHSVMSCPGGGVRLPVQSSLWSSARGLTWDRVRSALCGVVWCLIIVYKRV
ncbi:hypothetical protein BaRGS_00014299 [Batillaria attramentaria]|uniref:Uncharacterized protein n=1 Tax=Batillaria attramentaria TaxID=370345 RepID=A0ABD0L507_9CAEN